MTNVKRQLELRRLIYERRKRGLDCEALFKESMAIHVSMTAEERKQLSKEMHEEWLIWFKYAERSTFHRMNGETFMAVSGGGPYTLPSEEPPIPLPASSLSPWFRAS